MMATKRVQKLTAGEDVVVLARVRRTCGLAVELRGCAPPNVVLILAHGNHGKTQQVVLSEEREGLKEQSG